MNRPRLLAAIAAIILAIVGVLGMVAYVNGAEERAASGEQLAEVFIVQNRVPAGTPGESVVSYVSLDTVPAKLVGNDTVGSLEDLTGFVAEVPLLPGEVLSGQRFVDPKIYERELEREIERPPGLQEVTISLEPERAGGGLLLPGDTVGMIVSFDPFQLESELPIQIDDKVLPPGTSTDSTTLQTLHKVLVTSVQLEQVPEIGNREGIGDELDRELRLVPSGKLLVTLAVDIETAERIVFGAEFGRIWLTNEPGDTVEQETQIQNRGTIYVESEPDETDRNDP